MSKQLTNTSRLVALLAAMFLLPACGDSGDSGTTCANDSECEFGTICVEGGCVAVECSSVADCFDSNQSCVSVAGTDVCTETECGCPACPACPIGDTCNASGSCVPEDVTPGGDAATGGADEDATTDGGSHDDSSTGSADGSGGGPDDCSVTGCAAGETCNAATGECDTDTGGTDGDVCATCADDDDCPSSWNCNPTAGGKVCLPPCATNNDCETGWSCQGGSCTPAGFECKDCIINGCSDGFICDTIEGGCHAALPLCGQCTYDWECGPGNACIKESTGGRACKPRCTIGGDETCPATSTCGNDTDSGIDVCITNGSTCCYEDSGDLCEGGDPNACDPVCSGNTPICDGGQCKQCLTNDDCDGDGVCSGGSCTATECPAETPYLLDGACVQCVTNGDCPDGASCDQASNTCLEGECTDSDYPHPVELGGDTYCVQCSDDNHCDPGCTCDQQLFACSGECVVSGAVECETNADCQGISSEFQLICHESGLCVDDNGECDGAVVKCPYGNKCVSLIDLFFGGGFELPPEFGGGGAGGGTGIPGTCSCTPNAPGNNDFSSVDCPGPVECVENSGLTGMTSTWLCESVSCEQFLEPIVGAVIAAVICAL